MHPGVRPTVASTHPFREIRRGGACLRALLARVSGRGRRPIGALDGAGQLDARGDVELPEDVAQMSLDGLLAEEQLGRDLGIRLRVEYKTRHLELALAQGLEAGPIAFARAGTTMDAMPKLPKLALRVVAVTQGTAGIELRRRAQ